MSNDLSGDDAGRGMVMICDFSVTVRQTEHRRSQSNAQAVAEPFGKEVNPGFAMAADISANVEKVMGRDGFQEPGKNAATKSGPHSAKSEGNGADVRATADEVEIEGHRTLELRGVDFIMNHQNAVPIGEEQRLARQRKEPLAGDPAGGWGGGGGRVCRFRG